MFLYLFLFYSQQNESNKYFLKKKIFEYTFIFLTYYKF